MENIVKNYEICIDVPPYIGTITGCSVSCQQIINHIFENNAVPRTILDIGFGRGNLGSLIKGNIETSHWVIDGIDGFRRTCSNLPLFQKKIYRNIWLGLAQELSYEQISTYDVLCLFDVIEHLSIPDAKALLQTLFCSLGEQSRFIISTPMWYMPQDNDTEGDLEEHKFGVPAQSMFLLQPLFYHIDPHFLVGTFVFDKSSLKHLKYFQPTADTLFDIHAGRAHLTKIGIKADGVLYRVQR